ncbi:MAG: hypothetical protein ABIQ74_05375, partial [Chitinophagales bacterium]
LVKDLKCYNKYAFSVLDLLTSSRENGNYKTLAAWSEEVTSDQIVKKIYPLEGDYQYVILLSTEQGVDGTAIEIRNSRGEKLEYVYSVNDLDRNQITYFYTPPINDKYRLNFRVVNGHKKVTCMYMAILKGDEEFEYNIYPALNF